MYSKGNREIIISLDAATWMADDAEDSRFKPPLTITAKPDGTYHSFNVGRETVNT